MLSLCAITLLLLAQEPDSTVIQFPQLQSVTDRVEQPVELGQVRWRRDFKAGLKEAKKADKPVLLLFQEVPG